MTLGLRRSAALFAVLFVIAGAALITPPARAAVLTTSDAGVAFIKQFEGFCSHVYWDSGSAYIGYGTSCRSTDYPNGITEKQGETLMREALKVKEDEVNAFLSKYTIQLTQAQFDALMDLTYNLGTMWIDSSYRLYNELKGGYANYPDIEIVNAIGTWCHQGGGVADYLVDRRMKDAKLFLYSDYTGKDPHDYRYVTFDAGGGSVANSIQFFEYGKAYGNIQTPIRDGFTFGGWYTKSGAQITSTTAVSQNLAVTASWTQGSTPVSSKLFTDVSSGDWYYKYVTELSTGGIVSGYSDGAFHPKDYVTGGTALKLILLAVGFPQQNPTGSHWASGYMSLAVSKGIISDSDITNLDNDVSRQLIAKVAARAMGLPPIETPETVFSDTSDGYVLALYHANIITGSTEAGGLVFKPNDYIRRDEMSAIIWRIYNSGISQN